MRGVEQIPWLYDLLAALAERGQIGRWRRWLTAGAQGWTLDVGTGTGRNLPLFPAGTFVVAVDPSLSALRRARRRAPGAALTAASVEALPFRDGVFDTIASSLVFCSVPDPDRGLAEVRRVLRPFGHLRMLEHVRSVVPWRAWCQDLIQPVWTRVMGGCHPNRETERAVEAAGFRIDALERRARGGLRRFGARPSIL
jgi:ubiquinone/menaquinone biosynthesis C-methylase UbiE